MKLKKQILLLSFIVFGILYSNAQETDSLKTIKYNSIITSANTFFDAKNYDEAIPLYKQAQRIKPDEEYPKFKLEDINTILEIRKQIAENKIPKKKKQRPFWKRKKEKPVKPVIESKPPKKPKEKEKPIIKQEQKPIKVEEQKVEPTKTVEKQIIPPKQKEVKEEIPKKKAKPIIKQEEKPIKVEEQKIEPKQKIQPQPKEVKEEKPREQKKPKPVSKPKKKVKRKKKTNKKKQTKEEINADLKKLYTKERTVEIFETPNKTTTKVIINKGGNIVIFSKVKHSWGGIYYFKEIPGENEQSIVKEYFVRETKYSK